MEEENQNDVEKLLLTASGGPFLHHTQEQLTKVTPQEAVKHPRWQMGAKITVDSAGLINKGLEVIEAHWLFGVPAERIGVVIHPQSIVHSMIQFADGSVMAQMGLPDMRLPIQYALFHPERAPNDLPRLDLAQIGRLTFEAPDRKRFPALDLAFEAASVGLSMPAVLSAANEEAVEMFLAGSLTFRGITDVVRCAMDAHEPVALDHVDAVLSADSWARRYVREQLAVLRTGNG
jgi:1-deoxy-D-xylulose-5-phosphate reductoisomerase